jgi:4-hydroxy-2-oxoheptanedioate aldolase
MPKRTFAEIIRAGRPSLGTWTQITAEECVDMIGAAGLDFTIVDCEHGHFGIETAERLFRACDANGLAPIVRAPANDPIFIGRALDAGASAVLVPQISSPEDAARAVAAARYAPHGTRGACPCVRAGGHYMSDWGEMVRQQATDTGIIALVENRAGLESVEDIARVEGLLAMMVGPFDLSVALGHSGNYTHPECQAAIERMLAAAKSASLPVIVPLFNPDPDEARRQQLRWMEKGVRLFAVGSDKILFADAVRRYAHALR